MSILKVDTLQKADGSNGVHIAGHVIQTLQFEANEVNIGGGSGTTLINSTFTPKALNSKFAVWITVPNCTASSGGSVVCKCNLGTNSSPNSNTEIIYVTERMEGTGADDVRGIVGHDFGSYSNSNLNTHYASCVVTPDNNTVIARHSSKVKMLLQEIAQ